MAFRERFRKNYRSIVALGCAAATVTASLATDGRLGADGLIFDLSLAGHHALGIDRGPRGDHVAIVAIDERTLDADEFRSLPRVFLGPKFAGMLDAVFTAGARAVGFDIIFAYDTTQFDPNWDARFRDALRRHADRVVLGRSARRAPVTPVRLQVRDDAVGFLELPRDEDGVNRRVPASLTTSDGEMVPSFVSLMVARAGGAMSGEVLIAPSRHLETFPTYALVDVLRCADRDPSRLRAAFAGRAVLVGSTLPEEDRRLPPSRFIPPAPSVHPAPPDGGCRIAPSGPSDPDAATVPGIFIHAAGIDAVLAGRVPRRAPAALHIGLAVVVAATGAALATVLSPSLAAAALLAGWALLFALAGALLAFGFWLPVALGAISLPASMGIGYTTRYLVEDLRRRRLQQAFGHYLTPVVVDRLVSAEKMPELGGERREITVMFADLSGFTALSGRLPPHELMARTNAYLSLFAEEVERTGGYVNQFLGDAVMALWGAAWENPNHARDAVTAAHAIAGRVHARRRDSITSGEEGFWVKIGINSGAAVIGNVGATNRLSYTAVGETVNLAARFESLPGDYGCVTVIGEATRAALDGTTPTCELDLVKVKGKTDAVHVYEPFPASADPARYIAAYARALAAYRARRFEDARVLWLESRYPGLVDPVRAAADGDPATPNRVMADRAAGFAAEPPGADWVGEWVRETK